MVKIKITSTLTQPFVLFYRMPATQAGKTSPVIEIPLSARQILKEVVFPTQEHLETFLNQNATYINSKKIIIGNNVTGAQAQKINSDNSKTEKAQIKAKKDKVIENIEASISNGKTSLKLSVDKE